MNFRYENSKEVLKNINMNIKARELVTIVGPNGGGKTTLLKIIAGLIKLESGEILINGEKRKKNSEIAYVQQHMNFDNKFPITVYEVVLSGRIKSFGSYSKKDKLKAEQVIEEIGLTEYINRSFNDLSGGQKQRVLIARALAAEAKILLFDEPTSSIDFEMEKNLNSLLKKLSEKLTIILVTHDTGFVANITDRVFCLNKTIVEHPIDVNFDNMISSAYSSHSALVRHDIRIGEDGDKNE
jgi:zinc transport system ATP-binding protein